MKRIWLLFFIVLGCLQGEEGRFRALIIANNDYLDNDVWSKLETPINDAQNLRKILEEEYGFVDTIYEENATRVDIYKVLNEFLRTTVENDNVLIFYAGHGHYDEDIRDGFWVPVDAKREDYSFVSNLIIRDRIAKISEKSKHLLLLSDSCFSGDLIRGERGIAIHSKEERNSYYEKKKNYKSCQVITSGGKEYVADNFQGSGHSPFAHFLLVQLRKNSEKYYATKELALHLEKSVGNATKQMPQYGIISGTQDEGGQGEFFFVRKTKKKLPENSNFTLVDEEEMRWLEWQEKMNSNYEQIKAIEKRQLKANVKVNYWERFLKYYEKQQNPYSNEDDEKITEARKSLHYWQQEAQQKANKLEKIAIFPGNTNCQGGERISFSVKGKKTDGTIYIPIVTWSAKYGNIDSNGSYTAPHDNTVDIVTITAKENSQLQAKAEIKVTKKISVASYPGFTYLRERTYSCNGQSYTVKEYRHEQTGMEFAALPAGEFMMGGDKYDSEKPIHKVRVSSFLIAKTEVTQSVWQKIMGSNPSRFKGNNKPAERISWNDCLAFCEKTGLALPTEAQWEYACRSGSSNIYYWGNNIDGNYCWYGRNSSQTQDVAQKKANAFGLYDMSGNVWEWCADWYDRDYYKNSPMDNPRGPSSGSLRVLRGGSWCDDSDYCRSAYRGYLSPEYANYDVGFRPVYNFQNN